MSKRQCNRISKRHIRTLNLCWLMTARRMAPRRLLTGLLPRVRVYARSISRNCPKGGLERCTPCTRDSRKRLANGCSLPMPTYTSRRRRWPERLHSVKLNSRISSRSSRFLSTGNLLLDAAATLSIYGIFAGGQVWNVDDPKARQVAGFGASYWFGAVCLSRPKVCLGFASKLPTI